MRGRTVSERSGMRARVGALAVAGAMFAGLIVASPASALEDLDAAPATGVAQQLDVAVPLADEGVAETPAGVSAPEAAAPDAPASTAEATTADAVIESDAAAGSDATAADSGADGPATVAQETEATVPAPKPAAARVGTPTAAYDGATDAWVWVDVKSPRYGTRIARAELVNTRTGAVKRLQEEWRDSDREVSFSVDVAPATYTLRVRGYDHKWYYYDGTTKLDTKSGRARSIVLGEYDTKMLSLRLPAPTKVVAGAVWVSGSAVVGKKVAAKRSSWAQVKTYSYRWLRNGKPIRGATKSTYRITAADGGKRLSVRVTGKRTGFTSATKTSASKQVKRVLKASKPRVTGYAAVGATLAASAGKWTGKTKLRYQWLRNGTRISGATGRTYTVATKDLKQKISVKVTGKRSGYVSTSRTSSAHRVNSVARGLTLSELNAVEEARSYLRVLSFSRVGLIDQLRYEKYSKTTSTFAVDYIGVNWNKQAAKKAKSYLSVMSFSREGLKDQLEYEGFTPSQIRYALRAVGY